METNENGRIVYAGLLDIKGWHHKACTVISPDGISTCCHCQSNNLLQKIIEIDMEERKPIELPPELRGKKFRIRKLTPRECFRLMGVDDADIDKIQAYPFHNLVEYAAYSKRERYEGMTEKEKRKLMEKPISNSAQYKLAGNSIVVDVLYHIMRKLFVEKEQSQREGTQLTLF